MVLQDGVQVLLRNGVSCVFSVSYSEVRSPKVFILSGMSFSFPSCRMEDAELAAGPGLDTAKGLLFGDTNSLRRRRAERKYRLRTV